MDGRLNKVLVTIFKDIRQVWKRAVWSKELWGSQGSLSEKESCNNGFQVNPVRLGERDPGKERLQEGWVSSYTDIAKHPKLGGLYMAEFSYSSECWEIQDLDTVRARHGGLHLWSQLSEAEAGRSRVPGQSRLYSKCVCCCVVCVGHLLCVFRWWKRQCRFLCFFTRIASVTSPSLSGGWWMDLEAKHLFRP